MESLIPPILLMLVVGGVTGYFAGHLLKRVSGMALTVGIFAFIIIILIYIGTFEVKLDTITSNITRFCDIIGPLGFASLASSVPFVASFVAGTFVGYRRY